MPLLKPTVFPNSIKTSLLLTTEGPYNVLAFGADPTGLSDSTSAIQAAIDAAETATALSSSVPAYTWITQLEGGVVYFPPGWYRIDSKLTITNRTSLVGENFTACGIVAGAGYSDTEMVNIVDGTSPIFDSRIQDLRLHANNDASITRVIRNQAWQEGCGMQRVSVSGYQGVGVLIEDVSSGAAGMFIDDCWFAGFSNNTSAIHVESTVPNAFQLNLSNTTIDSSGLATNGVLVESGHLNVRSLHVENCTNGVQMVGGNATINGLVGDGDTVNLITIGSGFGGAIDANGLDINGATNTLDDNVTSRNIAGACSGFHFPFSPQSTSTTPSVTLLPNIVRTFYSGSATTITDFVGGPHRFILRTQDANTTIDVNGNSNITRADGVDTDYTEAAAWFDVWDDRGTWIIHLID